MAKEDIITTKSIGAGIVEVEEDFILAEEPMSRLVFHAQIYQKGIREKIIRRRRASKDDVWIPDEAIDTGPNSHIIWKNIPCSPCVTAYNNRYSVCKDNLCMHRISVSEVFDLVCRLCEI
ncbi:MAG: hypothetical protein WCE45_02350 [Sedimentisphaerales bacterium]